jgi:translation initiation factor IF-3
VLLIDAEGTKRGVVPIQDALRIAEEAGLDLVEVASATVPPVCKVMDYGKMAYQLRKRQAHTRAQLDMKEINFSMKISGHDIETKLKKGREFIGKGHKLRFNLILRGRERSYADTKGMEQLKRLAELMSDITVIEQQSKGMMGNRLFVILSPAKKEKEVKEKAPAAPKPAAASPAAAAKPARATATATATASEDSSDGSTSA